LVQNCARDESAGHVQKHRRRIKGPEEVCSQEVVPVVERMLTASQLEKSSSPIRRKEDEKRIVALIKKIDAPCVVAQIIQQQPTLPEVIQEIEKWYRRFYAGDGQRHRPAQLDKPSQNPRSKNGRAGRRQPESLKGEL